MEKVSEYSCGLLGSITFATIAESDFLQTLFLLVVQFLFTLIVRFLFNYKK